MANSDLPFNLEEAIEHIKAGKPLNGKDGLLTPLIKQLTEAALQAEQEAHIASLIPHFHVSTALLRTKIDARLTPKNHSLWV